jgi:hypothetical protein
MFATVRVLTSITSLAASPATARQSRVLVMTLMQRVTLRVISTPLPPTDLIGPTNMEFATIISLPPMPVSFATIMQVRLQIRRSVPWMELLVTFATLPVIRPVENSTALIRLPCQKEAKIQRMERVTLLGLSSMS